MDRRRFLGLVVKATAGSAVVYSFPSIIVPNNIAPQYLSDLYPDGIFYGPGVYNLSMHGIPFTVNASGIYMPLSRDDKPVIEAMILSPNG